MRSSALTLFSAVACAALATSLTSQSVPRPPANGPAPANSTWHALVGANVVTSPGVEQAGATIVIRDGRIDAVLPAGSQTPAGVRAWDCSGLTVYAAFVDPHVRVEVPTPEEAGPLEHWNRNVLPQRRVVDASGHGITAKRAADLRAAGFGTVALAPHDGVFRGRGAIIGLGEVRTGEARVVLGDAPYGVVGFRGRSRGSYPRSKMGATALIRQTLSDAAHWAATPAADRPPHLALQSVATTPVLLFDAGDELDALRAAVVASEFERPAWILGSGLEFRRLDAIRATGLPVIAPLAFPKPPRVDTLDAREDVTLRDLLTWEHAPTNPYRLLESGVRVALTTDRLASPKKFHTRLRRAMRHGLEHDAALAALTTTPAELLEIEDQVGRIAPGLRANLFVSDGRLGEEDSTGRAVWIDGRRHALSTPNEIDIEGRWAVTMSLGDAQVDTIEFRGKRNAATVFAGEKKVKASMSRLRERQLDLSFDAKELGGEGVITLNAIADGVRMFGSGADVEGRRFGWTARRTGDVEAAADATKEEGTDRENTKQAGTDATKDRPSPNLDVDLPLPFGAFGRTSAPERGALIVRGATIWTGGDQGILEDGVLIVNGDGDLTYVGAAADAPAPPDGARALDVDGLHVTPGLIDCHSHTGIRGGINEGTQSVTAEVRVQDVLNPDDVGWYRELAGGLTAVNQLHGSANVIGGQNNVVKLRWGVSDPDAMRVEGAMAGIKFALGENVKRSNSSTRELTRYPRTRMGVEALLRERFTAAHDYVVARATEGRARDLELEALAEILAGERLIHCHSYRQDEILMLCRVARDFGFRIGTFQHGLECYKVAEALSEVSRGASVFTDWWAYKYEVVDAIPENAAILHEQGVLVSFNSDSNELARRMNTEAAKAVKYGGVDPHTALQFVTLTPAKQLGVDDRIGSLEAGKDADFVVWSGDPLSSMSRCVSTWIDGARYWSVEEDAAAVESARLERERLIQLVLGLDAEEREGEDSPEFGSAGDAMDNLPGDCGCCEEGEAR